MSYERLPPGAAAAPAAAHSTIALSSSPTNKRNVGVLELKLKHRLLEDPNSVAIGTLHHHSHQDQDETTDEHRNKRGGSKYLKRAHKLPQLAVKDPRFAALPSIGGRPDSFEAERQSVMDTLELPSPTRSVVNKVVQQTKENKRKQQSELPPVAGVFKKRGAPQSLFPRAYRRNELPIMIESRAGGNTLRWTQDIAELDFSKLFPLFLEGLTEKTHPYSFLAREGAFQLLHFGRSHPDKLVECLPRVIPAVRQALDTHENQFIRDALTILQELTRAPGVGPLLVPYYRQLLPVLNMFKSKRRNLGDDMDFQQHKAKDVGEMILETLELLERTGGPDAFVNIKYMVPTYEGDRS